MKKNYVTKKGYAEYVKLLKDKEAEYQEHLKGRSDYGINTSDNCRSVDFDTKTNILLCEIADIKQTIFNLQIIEESFDTNVINIDDVVTVRLEGEEPEKVKLVGGVPDISREGGIICITINSPLGNALYKKQVGDVVSYIVKQNQFNVEILAKEKDLIDQETETLEK